MIDRETKKIFEELSQTVYGAKHKYRKILDNGLTLVNPNKPVKEVVLKNAQYKRSLYEYYQRYFTPNELMQYMVDELKKREEAKKKPGESEKKNVSAS